LTGAHSLCAPPLSVRRAADSVPKEAHLKLTFQNDVLGLAAETPEEQAICALLMAADRHVFLLHCTTDRGFALAELGQEDEARRAPLNITHAIEPRFQPISNLAHAPFDLDDRRYASVEGFWQSLKFLEPKDRARIARLCGAEAREAGKPAGQPDSFDYEGTRIASGSPEHWQLMRRACSAKFTQNAEAKAALLATGERWLTHRTRRDSRTIPGAIMAQIWMDLRASIEAGSAS
jgi:predicted NAD-dependent protein-ADP-ribosyltransferase YbiA (DUF1768 family)